MNLAHCYPVHDKRLWARDGLHLSECTGLPRLFTVLYRRMTNIMWPDPSPPSIVRQRSTAAPQQMTLPTQAPLRATTTQAHRRAISTNVPIRGIKTNHPMHREITKTQSPLRATTQSQVVRRVTTKKATIKAPVRLTPMTKAAHRATKTANAIRVLDDVM